MFPTLESREVHTWCVSLDVPAEAAARLYATLSYDERSRSARFRFERDRQHFAVAHGVLRDLLGRYLGTHPGDVHFVYNAFGKPELSPECGGRVRFNLSHSADLALIAVAAGAEVGVDVEHIRPRSDYAEVARCFFSDAEVDDLNRVPSHVRTEAFLSSWTKKEAYVKARGEGLAIPLTSFSVPQLHEAWSFYSLQPAAGYIGAVAVEGTGWSVRQRHWWA